jgi:hypothetical protein
MIPENIHALAKKNRLGDIERSNVDAAKKALQRLGIFAESQLHEFCVAYCLSSLLSPFAEEQLVDICEPTEEVAVSTNFAHEVWELPNEYICFTSCQGEGGFLYSMRTHAVYDFSLSERTQFLVAPEPKWSNFYKFIEWYLSPELAQ